MDLLSLHFARHALAEQAVTNPHLLPALAATDAEIAERVASAPVGTLDHDTLMGALHGIARSRYWPKVAREVLTSRPFCAACDPGLSIAHAGLQVHHKYCSFHVAILLGLAYLELDPRNLIVLGEHEANAIAPDHHLLLGHADDFRRDCNPTIDSDIVTFYGASDEAIRSDSRYALIKTNAPPDWSDWTDAMKISKRSDLLARFSPDQAILTEYGLPIPEPMSTWKP